MNTTLLLICVLAASPSSSTAHFTVSAVTQPIEGYVADIVPPCNEATFSWKDMKVKSGDQVKEGDTIITIQDTDGVIELHRLELVLAKEELVSAETALPLAKANFDRAVQLLRSKAVSQSEYDTCDFSFRKAKQDVRVAQAQVEKARQTLVLSTCPIKAPISGVVKITARPGDAAGPGRSDLKWGEIIDTSFLGIICSIPQKNAESLVIGKTAVTVVAVANSKVSFPGMVVSLSQTLNDDQTVNVLVRVKNEKHLLWNNQQVTVSFP